MIWATQKGSPFFIKEIIIRIANKKLDEIIEPRIKNDCILLLQ
jgi:hypothetical protein